MDYIDWRGNESAGDLEPARSTCAIPSSCRNAARTGKLTPALIDLLRIPVGGDDIPGRQGDDPFTWHALIGESPAPLRRFAADSPLEQAGFELAVPPLRRGKQDENTASYPDCRATHPDDELGLRAMMSIYRGV
jgi:hypothetical protein